LKFSFLSLKDHRFFHREIDDITWLVGALNASLQCIDLGGERLPVALFLL
jgi:hypothetical protein